MMSNLKTQSVYILVAFVGLSIFIFPNFASAATYTVCTTGCTATSTQLIFNNNDLAPGDIVEIRADTIGGTKTIDESITWGSNDGGDAANQVTLQGRSGDTIIIDGQNTRARDIYINGVSYVTVKNLTVKDATGKNIEGAGTTDGLIIKNIISTGGVNSLWFNAGTGIQIRDSTINQPTKMGLTFYNGAIINAIVDNNKFVGVPSMTDIRGIHFANTVNLAFTNNTISNWTTLNSYDKTFWFIAPNGLNFSGNTISNSDGLNVVITDGVGVTGSNNTVINPQGLGFDFVNSAAVMSNLTVSEHKFSDGVLIEGASVVTLNSSTVSSSNDGLASGDGFFLKDSSILTCNNCIAHNNGGDGFSANNTGILTCNGCLSYNNGITSSIPPGDGYTSHDTSTLNVYNSIGFGNYKSGIAVTGDSSGEISNNSFYNNYEPTNGSGWDSSGDLGIGVNSIGSWIIRNNITQGHPVEMMIGSTAVSGGVKVSSNYNDFYDSLSGLAFDYNGIFSNFINYKLASTTLELNSLNQNPLFSSSTPSLAVGFKLQQFSPAIDSGTGVGLSTDYVGNPIYGKPDMGAYEYQPPYTIGTNSIPTTGSVRIYTNGKYRMKSATSTGATTSFTVTPLGGNYEATTTQYMDISINNWSTTGDKDKQWTATSTTGDFMTHATTTVYTVGDLLPNTYYQFKIDGAASTTAITSSACNSNESCLSDSNGNLAFNYVGGYSTHTFALNKDNVKPTISMHPTTKAYIKDTKNPMLSWSGSTPSGIASYTLTLDGIVVEKDVASTITNYAPSGLSCGDHEWTLRALSNSGSSISETHTFSTRCDALLPVTLLGTSINPLPGENIPTIKKKKPSSVTTHTTVATPIAPSTPVKQTKSKNVPTPTMSVKQAKSTNVPTPKASVKQAKSKNVPTSSSSATSTPDKLSTSVVYNLQTQIVTVFEQFITMLKNIF